MTKQPEHLLYSPYKPRRRRGSAITEMAPAMFILLMVFFFPAVNLVALGLGYADCLYLHDLLLREAALQKVLIINPSPPPPYSVDYSCSTDPNGPLNELIKSWSSQGLGRFVQTNNTPTQKIYIDLTEGSNNARYVHCDLYIEIRPFLALPFPLKVPAINAPVPFTITGKRVIETMPV